MEAGEINQSCLFWSAHNTPVNTRATTATREGFFRNTQVPLESSSTQDLWHQFVQTKLEPFSFTNVTNLGWSWHHVFTPVFTGGVPSGTKRNQQIAGPHGTGTAHPPQRTNYKSDHHIVSQMSFRGRVKVLEAPTRKKNAHRPQTNVFCPAREKAKLSLSPEEENDISIKPHTDKTALALSNTASF